MKLDGTGVADLVDITVRFLGDGPDGLPGDCAADVHPLGDDMLALHTPVGRVVVAPIEGSRGLPLPRAESYVAQLVGADSGDRAVLRTWRFGRGIHLPDEPISVHVGEEILATIADRLGVPAVSSDEARRWLEAEFVLRTSPSAEPRLVAQAETAALGKAFRLIGTDNELDVREAAGHLSASRLTPRRAAGRLSAVLVQAEVAFTTSIDPVATGSRLTAMLAEGGYLRRWAHYNELEFVGFEEEAEKLGEASYNHAELLPTGAWRLDVYDTEGFMSHIRSGMSIELRDLWEDQERPERYFAEVEDVHGDAQLVDVRGIDPDATPPPAGSITYALQGARVSYKRRLDAARKLAAGDIPMPELALLLEMRSAPSRVVGRRLGWRSPATEAIFGAAEPTPAQKRAIELALNTPDLAVIQGPPGTGKTKVISAIAARVAEQDDDVVSSAGRRVLLTSHQHDAVDNVAARTRVFGLPTPKQGRGRSGASWIAAWRRERLDTAATLYNNIAQGEVIGTRAWVAERKAGYIIAPCIPESAADLLDEARDRCGRYISEGLVTDLSEGSSRLRRRGRPRERDAQLLASIRSLRTDAVSHADDGAPNARRVLKRLERADDAPRYDASSITRAASGDPLSEEDLADIRHAREELLDALARDPLIAATPTLIGDVVQLLDRVLEALDERLNEDGLGIARVLSRFVDDLETDPRGVELALGEYAAVIAATCQGSEGLAAHPGAVDDHRPIGTVIVDEAARANPLDLQIPLCLASRRVVLVGDQRQLPHIVDEALKNAVSATEAEALELEESMFGRLYRFLVAERRAGRTDRVVTLNAQYRMHPTLGRFVSQQFYEPHGETIESPLPADRFSHELPGLEGRCAVWLDVPGDRGAQSRKGTSWLRDAEAEVIAQKLVELITAAPELTFGVISFYRAQVEAVLEALMPRAVTSVNFETGTTEVVDNWRYGRDLDGNIVERLRIGTVDAFQGKEFDVVFLSAVRTPSRRDRGARAFGHLGVPNRLCVSMSRQRRVLIAVGDRKALTEHPEAHDRIGPLVEFGRLCDEDAS